MRDMTDAQRKAARTVMAGFPSLQINITRGDGRATLTPRKGSSLEGSPVTIIYASTAPQQIARELQQSCNSLMDQL